MSYLLPQLWLCLFFALLLGGFLGWLFRGNNQKKLTQIEVRWQQRFSDLEYSNQFLLNQLEGSKKIEKTNERLTSQLNRMKKAALISNKQLRTKDTLVSNLEKKLGHSKTQPDIEQSDTVTNNKQPSYSKFLEQQNEKSQIKELRSMQIQLDEVVEEKIKLINAVDELRAELIKSQPINK